jgi:hypothetical protein
MAMIAQLMAIYVDFKEPPEQMIFWNKPRRSLLSKGYFGTLERASCASRWITPLFGF